MAPTRAEVVAEKLKGFDAKKIPDASTIKQQLEKSDAFQLFSPDEKAATHDQLDRPGKEGQLIRAQVAKALAAEKQSTSSPKENADTLGNAAFPIYRSTRKPHLKFLTTRHSFWL